MKHLISKNGSSVCIVEAEKKLVDSLLDKNINNRPLNNNRVQSLMFDIKSGHWNLNGATIVVGSDGVLLDGQHRLTAIRNSGYPKVELILVNLAEDSGTMNTIDTGKVRSCGDVFKLNGVSNYTRSAAVTNSLLRFFTNKSNTTSSITRSESVEYYNKHKVVIDQFVNLFSSPNVKFIFNCSAMSAFASVAMAYPIEIEKIKDLVIKVSEADGLKKGTAEHAIYKFLVGSKASGKYNTGSRIDGFISAVASGVIQYLNNERCSFLRPDSTIIAKLTKIINK